jgi:AraC-like DNA-binding protein
MGESGLELVFFGITNFKIGNLPFDCILDDNASPVIHTGEYEEEYDFYFSSLVKEVASSKPYNEIFSKYLARLILIGILRLSNISEAKFVTNAIFTRMHNYLNSHFTEIESMDEVCEELKISKYYLSHVFKAVTGTNIREYRNELKLTKAKLMLKNTDMSIGQIACEVGFESICYFTEVFSKSETISPKKYRELHKRG